MQPKPAGAACLTCPGRTKKIVLPERAASGARLAVVGDAPHRQDIDAGRPFGGASGRMLVRGLATIGVRRHEVHWTNAILCEVSQREQRAARKCCATRLRDELVATGAPVIVAVGAIATQSTIGRGTSTPIAKWRGSIVEHEFGQIRPEPAKATRRRKVAATDLAVFPGGTQDPHPGQLGAEGDAKPSSDIAGAAPAANAPLPHALVLPILDPFFVSKAPKWKPVLELDMARVGRVMRHGFTPLELQAPRRIVVARTLEELTAGLSSLATDDIGFDVETVGLGPTQTRLVCFCLSDGVLSLVVPWSRASNGLESWWGAHQERVAEAVSQRLAGVVTVTHNGPAFDHIVAARYGIRIARWDDTLLATHSYRSELPKNLAHVVTQGLDVAPWKTNEDRGASIDRLWVYNARDTLYTIIRWRQIQEEMKAA